MVAEVEAQSVTATSAAPGFDQVTRGIRRCIMLARDLATPAQTTDRVARRKHIIRAVEDCIQRDIEHPDDAAALRQEMLDRLDTLDGEAEIQ